MKRHASPARRLLELLLYGHGRLPLGARLLHLTILTCFLGGFLYGVWQIFVVLAPGAPGPLGARASTISHELMMARRAYAIETWIIFGCMALYLAFTEILPRIQPLSVGTPPSERRDPSSA